MRLLIFFLAVLCMSVSCRSTEPLTVEKSVRALAGFPDNSFWLDRPKAEEVPLVSAHRARPELAAIPENSLVGIAELVRAGSFILEMDVAMSADSVLFLFHDDDLDRLTFNRGNAAMRRWAELDTMRLRDPTGNVTRATIPSLIEALNLAKGKAFFTLDRKNGVPYSKILEAVQAAGVDEAAALILYDDSDYEEWAKLNPLGPMSFTVRTPDQLDVYVQRNRELYARFGLPPFRRREGLPAVVFAGVGDPSTTLLAAASERGVRTIVGTFGDLDQQASATDGQLYRDLVTRGVDIIATDRPLAAYEALYDVARRRSEQFNRAVQN